MIHLDLTPEEVKVLRGILEYDLSELRREIADTDNWEFKEGLKKKEEILRKVSATLT